MTNPEASAIAERLTPEQKRDLTINWDDFCDADRLQLPPDYPDALMKARFVILDAVDEDDLETSFAWELGIEPGGSVYRLTPLGLAVRTLLKDNLHEAG